MKLPPVTSLIKDATHQLWLVWAKLAQAGKRQKAEADGVTLEQKKNR